MIPQRFDETPDSHRGVSQPSFQHGLVVLYHLIEIPVVQHHVMVDGACHQADERIREALTESPQERNNAKHISKLVMLSYNQDPVKCS